MLKEFFKRKKYLINKDFQLKFILYTLSPSIVSISVFYLSSQIYFIKQIQQGKSLGLPLSHPYFLLIKDQKESLNSTFLISGIVCSIFFIGWGIYISHKIAGPLYRLTRYFDKDEPENNQGKLTFRPGDFFQEIPRSINQWQHRRNKKNSP